MIITKINDFSKVQHEVSFFMLDDYYVNDLSIHNLRSSKYIDMIIYHT